MRIVGRSFERIGAVLFLASGFHLAILLTAPLPAQPAFPKDDRVTFQLGNVTAAPGEPNLIVPLSINVEAGGPTVAFWYAFVRFDPTVLKFVWAKERRGDYGVEIHEPSLLEEDGTVLFVVDNVDTRNPEELIAPSSNLVALNMQFCVLSTAPRGTYPIQFVDAVRDKGARAPSYYTGFVNYEEMIRSLSAFYTPAYEAGSVTVAGDPVSSAVCPSPPPESERKTLPDDPRVTFQVGEITAAPGETNLILPLSILVESGGPIVGGWLGIVHYDASVLSRATVQDTRSAGYFYVYPPLHFREGRGAVGIEVAYGRRAWEEPGSVSDMISPSNGGVVANLQFCVPETTPPGTYPVHFEFQTPVSGSGSFPTYFHRYLEDDVECRQTRWCDFHPLLASGSVIVSGAPISGAPCPAGPPIDPVTFSLGEATAAPGEEGVSIPLSISVKPGAGAGLGWEGVLRYDPSVMGGVSLESTREAENVFPRGQEQFSEPGTVSLAVLLKEPISDTNDGVVSRLRFCVLGSAQPGSYPIQLVPLARHFGGLEVRPFYATSDGSLSPLLQNGALSVAGEPKLGDCHADAWPGARFKATYKLLGGNAVPGEAVVAPFFLKALAKAQGFSFSVNFDEEVLQATDIEKVFVLPDGTTNYAFEALKYNNDNQTPGDGGVDEGFLVGAVIYSSGLPQVALPAERDNEVLRFHFRVEPAAPVGTTTEVRFQDGARPPGGQGTENVVTVEGRSIYPSSEAAYVYIPGLFNIVGDVTIFIRGDSNGDRSVNLSDAVATLGYLFLGSEPPACFDAADVNDDGQLGIADPIYLLSFLFLEGAAQVPPPYPQPGEDPTLDSMGCLYR